jgi:septum formation inhibitor-activating ATPase MinD
LLNTLQEWNVPVGLVIRVLGGTAVQPLAIAEKLQTPLWATIPTDNRIIEQIECGFGISMVKLSSFNRAIAQLASRLVGVGNNVRTA